MKLTVLTPSYNQAAFLERSLASVHDQGWPEVEHLVVDGGSTDGSVEILERWSDRLAWWVSEPDRGQAHALNKALQHATGDAIAWINSDDYYLPGAFDAALPLFEDRAVQWVAGACRFLYPDGTVESVWRPSPLEGRPLDVVTRVWSLPQSASFWRRGVFDRVGGLREDLDYVMDTEFILRVALAGIAPTILDRELAVRWLHEDAKSADRRPFELETDRVVADLLRKLPARERAELFRRRAVGKLSALARRRA